MNHKLLITVVAVLTVGLADTSAQTVNFSAKEQEQIHDSIRQSRWDIGGNVSRYSFRYMSEFFPVAIINKPESPYVFKIEQNQAIENSKVHLKNATLSLEDYLNLLHIASFIVVHKGTIVYEKYFSMLPEDQHTLQSVTKVVTATLVTSLINEGTIDSNKSIDFYIPELVGSDWQGISVKNILDMKSGMDVHSIDFETGPFSNPEHKNYKLEAALGILPPTDTTPASVYKYMTTIKKDRAAGLDATYTNLDTFMLGWLAETVTGKKYADLVTERIWKPMGASSNAYVCVSPGGTAWPHGGLSATLRDLARFGMMFTSSEIKEKKGSLISSTQLHEIFEAKPIQSPFGPFKWAYQWDMAEEGILFKAGFGGQALYVVPEKELVIAYFNYVDKEWDMKLISEKVLNTILTTIVPE